MAEVKLLCYTWLSVSVALLCVHTDYDFHIWRSSCAGRRAIVVSKTSFMASRLHYHMPLCDLLLCQMNYNF
jgi:hypothetical protein